MWPYPKVVAHRGGGTLAPENTLAALRSGVLYGFKAVEFDVMLTKDAVPVIMHDPDFGRTIAGAGSVHRTMASDLMAMDAGIWFGPAFAGEQVPSLTQVLAFCQTHDVWMNIEIKPAAPQFEVRTGEVVARMVQDAFAGALAQKTIDPATLPLFSSFSFAALMAAKRVAPAIPRGLLVDTIPPDWKAQLQQLGAVSLHTNHQHLTLALAQEVRDAGYGLFCYTVNDMMRAQEIMSWSVDGFCTDRIDLIGPHAF